MTSRMFDIEIKELSGSFGAATFVGQVAYWSKITIKKYKREKFYKSNTEWHEEICMSRSQFDRVRSLVATRIRKGMSKQRMMRIFNSDGSLAPLSHLILYWKDSDNKMWYWFNHDLYKKILEKEKQAYGLLVSPQVLEKQPLQQSLSSLDYSLDHINDDDDSFNSSDSGEFSLTEEKEAPDTSSLQDENDLHPQPKIYELLKQTGLRGKRLETFSLLKDEFVHAWLNYVNTSSSKIVNKAAYLSSQLQSGEYPPEFAPTPSKSSSNPFEGLSWNDFANSHNQQQETSREKYQAIIDELHKPTPEEHLPELTKYDPCLGRTSLSASHAWTATKSQLELQLDRASFDTWLRKAQYLTVENDTLIIEVQNQPAADMLQHRLYRNVRRVLRDVLGEFIELRFQAAPKKTLNNRFQPVSV